MMFDNEEIELDSLRPSPNFGRRLAITRYTLGPREIHDRRARGMFWGSFIRSS